jgi:hypothetical protein
MRNRVGLFTNEEMLAGFDAATRPVNEAGILVAIFSLPEYRPHGPAPVAGAETRAS